ncbi:MAG: c-type cytochrome [Phenylobacterium sp.]
MSLSPTRLIAAAGILAAATASAALAQPPAPPAPAPATAPAAAPPAEFSVCSACHESTAGARASLGPNLFGIGGRKAGSVADYDYSPAMKSSTVVWSADTLAAFVADPNKTVPGNKMDYSGTDAATAKAIADYLMTLK